METVHTCLHNRMHEHMCGHFEYYGCFRVFTGLVYYAVCVLLCSLQYGRLIACCSDLKLCTGRNIGKLECAKRSPLCLSTPQPLAIWEQGPGNLSLMGNLLLIDLRFAVPASRTPITQAVRHITGVSASLSLWCHRTFPTIDTHTHTQYLLNDAVQYSKVKYINSGYSSHIL